MCDQMEASANMGAWGQGGERARWVPFLGFLMIIPRCHGITPSALTLKHFLLFTIMLCLQKPLSWEPFKCILIMLIILVLSTAALHFLYKKVYPFSFH